MQIDVNWLSTNFNRFNADYFNGELPLPRFRISNARTELGTFKSKVKGNGGSRSKEKGNDNREFTISLSDYWTGDVFFFQNILLHEMIHFYIVYHRYKDNSPHGTLFRAQMKRLNLLGWDISIGKKLSELKPANKTPNDWRVVLAVVTNDEKYYLCVISQGSVRRLDMKLRRTTWLKKYSWHITNEDYFQTFRQCRSLRGKFVTKDFWEQKVKNMKVLRL